MIDIFGLKFLSRNFRPTEPHCDLINKYYRVFPSALPYNVYLGMLQLCNNQMGCVNSKVSLLNIINNNNEVVVNE